MEGHGEGHPGPKEVGKLLGIGGELLELGLSLAMEEGAQGVGKEGGLSAGAG
jgi:hypothetical protein